MVVGKTRSIFADIDVDFTRHSYKIKNKLSLLYDERTILSRSDQRTFEAEADEDIPMNDVHKLIAVSATTMCQNFRIISQVPTIRIHEATKLGVRKSPANR